MEKDSIAKSYKDLRVFQQALELAAEIFERTKKFPAEERYSMIDQIRRSSRSVCTNMGEAWRKRRYQAAFISKLNDSEAEACETQIWSLIAMRCGYLSKHEAEQWEQKYDYVLAQLVVMMREASKWILKQK